jgi:hypothetical protein
MLGGGRWIQQGYLVYPTRKPRSQHTVRCWNNGDNKEVLASPLAGLDGEARQDAATGYHRSTICTLLSLSFPTPRPQGRRPPSSARQPPDSTLRLAPWCGSTRRPCPSTGSSPPRRFSSRAAGTSPSMMSTPSLNRCNTTHMSGICAYKITLQSGLF